MLERRSSLPQAREIRQPCAIRGQQTVALAAVLPFKHVTSKKALGHTHRSRSKIPANTAFPSDVLPTSCCHTPKSANAR